MIRHLHPTDSPRLIPFRQAVGRGQAFPLARALHAVDRRFSAVSYAGLALSPRAWRTCWVWDQPGRLGGVVRAGPRSGPTCWEIRELFLARGIESECADILQEVAAQAACAGARRLFLRIAEGGAIFDGARRAGFLPQYTEFLYRSEGSGDLGLDREPGTGPNLRIRRPEDEARLFSLQSLTSPPRVRIQVAPTVDDWRDGLERPARSVRDLVADNDDGQPVGWVRSADTSAGRYVSVVCQPFSSDIARGLLSAALDGGSRPAVALVPSYDESLVRLLETADLKLQRTYEVLVRPIAVPVALTRGALAAVG